MDAFMNLMLNKTKKRTVFSGASSQQTSSASANFFKEEDVPPAKKRKYATDFVRQFKDEVWKVSLFLFAFKCQI